MAGATEQDRESCQFPFVVDEKPTFVSGGSAGEQSGGAQEVPYGGLRWQMLARGFRAELLGVAMKKLNETGYNRPGIYLIDDWR